MNAVQEVAREGLIDRFLRKTGVGRGLRILEQPSEELQHELSRGRGAKLWGARQRGPEQRIVRKEENYLYSTRRFPYNIANDTIGSGLLVVGDYDFFASGIGDPGSAMGYFTLAALGYLQTNIEKGGRVPTGKGFALYELAVSFGAEAVAGDIAQLLDVSSLRFEKGGQGMTLQHGPLSLWPGGTGISGHAATTAATTTIQAASNGQASLAVVRRFNQARRLNAADTFKYVVSTQAVRPKNAVAVALSAFTEMRIWLFGYHYERVQE